MKEIDLLRKYKRDLQFLQDEISLLDTQINYLTARREQSKDRLHDMAAKICEIEGHKLSADKTFTKKKGTVRKCLRCGDDIPVNKIREKDVITKEKVFKKITKLK